MKTKVETILNALSETPRLLEELISEIDPVLYKNKIIKGKWSIHEHATHIAVSDIYGFQKRLIDFKEKEKPIYEPFSANNFDQDFFIKLNLKKAITDFFEIRQKTVELAKAFNSDD